ncbi:methyl-accepting chemotaxis protein [Pseudoalteromonas sp. JC3]|uniref:methyl-accepting chemotaxis protein n=1 Tax=Pseudoalteromonas sp. JC3 TaxID=2810196 RepID=UPI0019D0DA23|nr:methyl-accepting chemotaxis protein [Pseudoalteromonas sp. JC3]MBR8843724.1 methyl-accepting chemotaxis protein [Pseudoalteromonas sp. JC3]WJE08992.1 methyl-accepting chemotaxis protein [Pseudoalteromonas sp. JC3]
MKPSRIIVTVTLFNLASVTLAITLLSSDTAKIAVALGALVLGVLFQLLYFKKTSSAEKHMEHLVRNFINDNGVDLTYRFNEQDKNISKSCLLMNDCFAVIEHIISEVYASSSRLHPMADSLRDTYASMTQKATLQHTHGEYLATSIQSMLEISARLDTSLEQIYASVENATTAVKQTRLDTDKSQKSLLTLADNIKKTNEQIELLKTDSNEISSVLEVISAIAEQTNLLALNAAIEAARAGELGRGFAVVADEVRNLAARTSQSTKEVSLVIRKIQSGTDSVYALMQAALEETDNTVKLSEASTKEVDEIENAMLSINQMSHDIHRQVGEQKQASDEAQESIESMVHLNSDALSSTRIQAVSNRDLIALSQSIHSKLSMFKISDYTPELDTRKDSSRVSISNIEQPENSNVGNADDIELF